MTDFCALLDSYLDGTLTEEQSQRFESHAAECDACESALDLEPLSMLAEDMCPPDVLAAALAATEGEWPETWSREIQGLASVACPPAVLGAAMSQTRRAPDRTPAPSTTRRTTRWAVGFTALIAIGLAWTFRAPSAPDAVEIAESPVDSSSAPVSVPATAADEVLPLMTAESPSVAPPASQPSMQAPPQPSSPEPPVALAPSPDRVAQAEPPPAPSPEEMEPSVEEVDAAREELALAFALIDDAQSKARARIRTEAGPLSSTLDQTLPF